MVSGQLRHAIQTLIRRLGVLSDDRTPCGKDLPVSDAHALQLLREHGALPQSALQSLLGIDKSSVSRLRARLEHSGHIEVAPSFDGGRPIALLQLTARGRHLATELEHASGKRFARLMNHIPEARRTRVLAALADLNAALAELEPTAATESATLARVRSIADGGPTAMLSRRQAQVLQLAAQGLTNAEIGAELRVGKRTVETHRLKASRKLRLGTRTLIRALVAYG
jgi:DNA-binding CsgD family transcriptional regulator/DNA-binding MarR family transcriptional regulator